MLLEVTVVAGVGVAPFAPTECSITWPPGVQPTDCTGLSLQRALAPYWPGCWFTVGGEELERLHAGSIPLVNGAVIVAHTEGTGGALAASGSISDTPPAGESTPGEGTAVVLVVSSGPGAGAVFTLQRGSYTLGRGQCRICVADPALSRHHGTIHVGSRSITLTPATGTSGFSIRRGRSASAEPVKGAVVLEVGHTVICGSSSLELFLPPSSFPEVTEDPVTPSSTLLDPSVLEPLTVQSSSGSARNRVAMMVTGLLPLVLGVALALLTGSWMFLAFSAMGAITVLVPLFGGSQRRKAFRAAVKLAAQRDADRQARTFPDAGSLMLAAGQYGWGPSRSRARPPVVAVALRLGTATQAAALVVSPEDHAFTPPLLPALPLVALLGSDPFTVSGPSSPVLSLLNFTLMQLDAAAIPVVLWGSPDIIPLAARFLPRTTLVTSMTAAAVALKCTVQDLPDGPVAGPVAVLVSVNESASPLLASIPGLRVAHFAVLGLSHADSFAATTGLVELRAIGNRVTGAYAGRSFIPDGVPSAVFDAYARRRAVQDANASSAARGTVGTPVRRGSLSANTLPWPDQSSVAAVRNAWSSATGGPLRPVPLGQSVTGPVMFDFLRDGPHLLVGGTTGSGKSALLRTLVGSLAAAHSPADLQFVLIDFKGGAGLGVLGKLPHTSSLITDLGGQGMDRTLASLRAEIRHREAALAASESPDSYAYRAKVQLHGSSPEGHAMAHLMIVIDEFRVLVDQFPEAMAELMRIAAVGRSLGIHLIMATQRPQGAVNADIRANVTSSICLRVQSTFDSTDVIGTGVAATISVGVPGRAYISRAGAAPEEFHSATLRLPQSRGDPRPDVQLAGHLLTADPAPGGTNHDQERGVSAVAQLLVEAWQESRATLPGWRQAPAVVARDLPVELDLGSVGDAAGMGWTAVRRPNQHDGAAGTDPHDAGPVLLGLVDVPSNQTLEPLLWHPRVHSHLAFFGTTSETGRAVALVAGQLMTEPALTACVGSSGPVQCLMYFLDGDGALGTWADSAQVGGCITPENLRTAAHLVHRLAQTARSNPSTFVLCISDWGRWVTALRSSPWHDTEDAIVELIRFSPANVVVVLGGGRELLMAPFLAAIPNRVFLSCGSSAESTMLWPRLPRFNPVPGRAAIAGPINEQAGRAGLGQGDPDVLKIAQLGRPSRAVIPVTAGAGSRAAETLLIAPLPRSLSMAHMRGEIARQQHRSEGGAGTRIVLGLGGDGRELVVACLSPGAVLPVVGGPGSGKSSFLQAMVVLNPGQELLWLDDAMDLPQAQLQEATRSLAAGAEIVAAFSYPGPAVSVLPLEWGLRTAQQGIVLMPQRPGDADLFGVRLDTAGGEPPGRGVLLDRGRRTWFQFPLPENPH